MAITPTRTFAVVDGAEGQASLYGNAIFQALQKQPGTLVKRILTSSATTGDVQVVAVDDPKNLAAAFRGVDIVLSFPDGWEALAGDLQEKLADTAKEAGVKLFIPFEWGHPLGFLDSDPEVLLAAQRVRKHLTAIKLPFCIFQTGPALDIVLPGLLHIDTTSSSATVTGLGEMPISWLTSTDAARFTATVLSQQPLTTLSNRVLAIQGDSKTTLETIAIYSHVVKGTLTLKHLDVEEERVKGGVNPTPKTFLTWLMVAWSDGRASIKGAGDNAMVEGFEVETVRQVLETKAREGRLNAPPP